MVSEAGLVQSDVGMKEAGVLSVGGLRLAVFVWFVALAAASITLRCCTGCILHAAPPSAYSYEY